VPARREAIWPTVLFIGSGLLTYQIYYWIANPDRFPLVMQLLTGIPFGLACSVRFIRSRKWIPLAVLLDSATWVAAYRLGLPLAGNLNPYAGMAVAGILGGLGVTASTGLGCRSLYTRRALGGAALVGAIAGLPFGLLLNRSGQEALILAISFPLWQVAVGLWIGMISSNTRHVG
jgi:hypothetical protein